MKRSNMLVILCYVFMVLDGHFVFGDLCSKLNSDETLQCGEKTISKDRCVSKGCCWNETRFENAQNFSCYRSKQHNGTCIRYPEYGICYKYLNISVPQYRNTPRFIDYNFGLNRTDELLANFQGLINVVAEKNPVSEYCLNTVRILLCQYILTPCLEDGSFIQICRRDCDMYEKTCPNTLQKLIGAATISLHLSKVNFVHVSLPECQKLQYEEDLVKVGKTCYLTGFFNHTAPDVSVIATTTKRTKSSKDNAAIIDTAPNVSVIATTTKRTKSSKDNAAIIASVIVVGTVLVVAFLVAFLFYRRRKNRAQPNKRGTTRGLGNFPSISVKDHINMLSADVLLKSKMPINDVKMIRQFPVDRVAYEKDLGEGQFGQVFQGRAIGLNEQAPEAEVIVAVKTLKKGSSAEAKSDFNQEACLMNYLCHPNIVRLLAVSAIEEPYCMIFEFMSKGDLSEYLRKSEPSIEDGVEHTDNNKNFLSQATLIHMCIDIARGLEYLANHRLIHRDVATRNCLVADDLTIKIADFGMSRDIYSNNYYKIEKDTVLPIRWLSPEAVLFGKFTIQSDIYSYGILLWEVFTFSKQPYYGYTNKEVLDFIAQGVHLAKPDFCPDFIYPIMKKCWSKEPDQRPFYDRIIDALNGEELLNDTPKPREQHENEAEHEYQNFAPYSDNAVDAVSVGSNETNEDPLIKSAAPEQTAKPSSNNPAYKQQRSNTDSEGSANSGMDSDSEVQRPSSRQSDNVFSRMNKTYV